MMPSYPKIKIISLHFIYLLPRKAFWCKNHENPSDRESHTWAPLKVHKNENFFGIDFEFCTISLLVMHKLQKICWKNFFNRTILRGDMIIPRSLRTTQNEKNLLIIC